MRAAGVASSGERDESVIRAEDPPFFKVSSPPRLPLGPATAASVAGAFSLSACWMTGPVLGLHVLRGGGACPLHLLRPVGGAGGWDLLVSGGSSASELLLGCVPDVINRVK